MMLPTLRTWLFPALASALIGSPAALAQVPAQCLEIESILVDACIDLVQCPGASEGQNEMVRFRTGPQPIALSELEADWPNNSWNGLVQDATTAALTDSLNATIQGCGWLLEPPSGVIPPGSQVLLVTSTMMCTAANSFANLSDTLYIVFQAPGNTSGHFANHNNGAAISPTPVGAESLRTLILIYLPTSCADTAVYDRAQLVNVFGTYGGASAENDGATAQFSWPGPPTVTYVNYGCQAPFEPTLVSVIDVDGSICNGAGNVQLVGSVTGTDVVSVLWQGGTGSFDDPTSLTTNYTAGAGDIGPVVVQLCAFGACGLPICIDYTLPGGAAPLVTITPDGPTALCPGQSVTLTASGADSYVWSTTEVTASITVSAPGTYSVEGTNACGTGDAQVEVTQAAGPTVSITPDGPTALCPGQSVTLTASGADTYLWSTTEVTASITVSAPGTYSVEGTNACGTGDAQVEVTQAAGPTVIITPNGSTDICPGQNVVLTASGADTYLWSTQEGTESITVTQAGTYSVTGTNSCGTASAQTTVNVIAVSASFTAVPAFGDPPLDVSFTNSSSPANGAMSWQFGDGGTSTDFEPTHTYVDEGTYTVTLTVSAQGCVASATAIVVVGEGDIVPSIVEVPNVFTPNGDGVNDQFRLDAIGIERIEVFIFNRYGQEVARLQRARQAWDGRTFGGEPCSDGTYFWVLEATGFDGVNHSMKGSLTLLR